MGGLNGPDKRIIVPGAGKFNTAAGKVCAKLFDGGMTRLKINVKAAKLEMIRYSGCYFCFLMAVYIFILLYR